MSQRSSLEVRAPIRKLQLHTAVAVTQPRKPNKMQKHFRTLPKFAHIYVPFGVTYEKIGTIQRRLAWPLHKDDTLSRSGRPTGLNIYFLLHLKYLSELPVDTEKERLQLVLDFIVVGSRINQKADLRETPIATITREIIQTNSRTQVC